MLSDVINGNCWHILEAVTGHWNNTSLGQRENVGPLFETYKKWLSLTSVAIDWDETSSHNDGRAGLEPEMRWECVWRRRTDVGEIAVKEIAREDVTSNSVLELIWTIDNSAPLSGSVNFNSEHCTRLFYPLHCWTYDWLLGPLAALLCMSLCPPGVTKTKIWVYTAMQNYSTCILQRSVLENLIISIVCQLWSTFEDGRFKRLFTGCGWQGDYTRLTIFPTWGSRPSRPFGSHSGTQDDRPSHQWI